MFNTCSGCGVSNPAKEIDPAGPFAVCPGCGYKHRFLQLPLFILTGPSGAGKSTVALHLAGRMRDFVVIERDLWWRDEFIGTDGAKSKEKSFHEFALEVAKSIGQSGRPVIMAGATIPANTEPCVERRYFTAIHYLALVCDDDILAGRLMARPAWRNSSSQDFIDYHLEFNRWLKANAKKTSPPMTLLDNSRLTLEETLVSVEKWARSIWRGGKKEAREGVARYLDKNGVVIDWPAREPDKKLVVGYLTGKFAEGTNYTEKEVMGIINAAHSFGDPCLLRRELVDRGFLGREADGRRYWRITK